MSFDVNTVFRIIVMHCLVEMVVVLTLGVVFVLVYLRDGQVGCQSMRGALLMF